MKPKEDVGGSGLVIAKLLVKVTQGLLIHQYKIQMGYKNQSNLYKVGNSRPITQEQVIQKHVITRIIFFTSHKAGQHDIKK